MIDIGTRARAIALKVCGDEFVRISREDRLTVSPEQAERCRADMADALKGLGDCAWLDGKADAEITAIMIAVMVPAIRRAVADLRPS